MDWKVFLLLLLVMDMCYRVVESSPPFQVQPPDAGIVSGESVAGEPICDTDINNTCYCVLDSTKNTNNWFRARSYCRDDVKGTLIDINSADTDTFVQKLLVNAVSQGVSSAWLGVNDLNEDRKLSFLSQTALTYSPNWSPSADESSPCTSLNTATGYWNRLQCTNSDNALATICSVPPLDQFGYSIDTGCPLNAHVYGDKCFQAISLSTNDFNDLWSGFSNSIYNCKGMTPAGDLILPTSDAENEVIRTLAKLTEFDKFWLKIEHHPNGDIFKEHGSGYPAINLTYQNWDDNALTSFQDLGYYIKLEKAFVMNVNTGNWEYDDPWPISANGVMCVFDIATPTPAVKSPLCPSAPAQASTVVTTPVNPSTSTPVVETTPASTSTPAVISTPAPTSKPAVESTTAPTSTPAEETTPAPTPISAAETTPASTQTQAKENTTAPRKGCIKAVLTLRLVLHLV